MKKYTFVLIILTLVLAGLACNLPYQSREAEIPVMFELQDGFRVETRYYGDTVITIAVPNSYYLGDSGTDLSALVDSLGIASVPVTVDLQGLLRNTQDDILVWGYDTGSSTGIPTSFVVFKSAEYAFMPLGLVSTLAGTIMGNNVDIIEEHRLTIAGRDTVRLITVTREAGYEVTQAVYIFKEAGKLYLVGFNADRQGVYAQLNTYDAIVASLTIADLG